MKQPFIILCSEGIVSNVETIEGTETVILNKNNPMIFDNYKAAKKMADYLTGISTEKFKTKKFTRKT